MGSPAGIRRAAAGRQAHCDEKVAAGYVRLLPGGAMADRHHSDQQVIIRQPASASALPLRQISETAAAP